jgi:hypothetical protein
MATKKTSGSKLADMMYGNPEGAAFGVYPQAKRGQRIPSAKEQLDKIMADERAMELPQFGKVDLSVPTAGNRAMGQRMVARDVDLKRQADQDMSPLEKLAGGMQAGRLMGSGMYQAAKSIPTAITKGQKAAEDYIAENIYQPTQPKAYEYAQDIGDFLSSLETDYKIPPIIPEAVALQFLAGPAKQQAGRVAKQAAKQGALNLAAPRTLNSQAGVLRIGSPSAPQAEALRLAQQRAALPVERGGLGLHANNTPEQRAAAMGFDRDTYHGSFRDIERLDPSLGSTESHAGKGVYSTDSPKDASLNYASIYGPDVTGRVERGLEERDKDFRKIYGRMRDEVLTPRQQEIILRNTVDADNLGVVYPLKVRSDKSIHLDAPEANPVRVGPFEQYDEATDTYIDTPQTAKFREALDEFGELGGEANPIYEVVQDGDGPVPARDVFNAVKKTGNETGLYDPYTGDIVSGGVAAGDFVKHFGIDEIRHTPEFRNQQLNIGNEHTISLNPDNVRSRFAAFDPFRKDVATAAAMGVLAPDLLAKEKEKKKDKDKESKKAHGGRVHFSDNPDVMQLELAGGGGVKAALKAAAKGAQNVLPAAERDANLAKFLEKSKVPQRLYHGTTASEGGKGQEAIRRIKPSKDGALGSGVYLTPSSAHASGYSGIPNDEALAAMAGDPYAKKMADQFMADRASGTVREGQQGGNMLPVHAQLRNPLIINGKGDPMVEALTKLGMDEDSASRMVERAYEQKGYIGKQVQQRAQAAGYDGLMQYRDGDLSEVVSYNPNAVKSAIGNQGTYDINDPDLSKAAGGAIRMGGGGALAKASAKGAKAPMKASEALGRIEGRPLFITQADRTKVGGGFLGGPGFSGLQLTEPEYRAAEAAWAVKNPGTAKTILGGKEGLGQDPVFAAMLGTPTQHQSNQMVFDKLLGGFLKAAKRGELDPAQRDKINMILANSVNNNGVPIFPPDVDILDKNFKNLANTFDRRSVTASLIGGTGVGGKKGQIIDFNKIIRDTTDPALVDSPTGALGNRLFTLSGGIIDRPDLHPAFPTILQGEDLGVNFDPVAREIIMKDFAEKIMREKGRKPGYMDYTKGYPPSQLITEDILTELQKMGKKAGGAVRKAEGGEVHGLSTADLLYLQSQEDLGKLPAHAQREAITNMGGQEVRQRMAGKLAGGGEITADDLILEERKL